MVCGGGRELCGSVSRLRNKKRQIAFSVQASFRTGRIPLMIYVEGLFRAAKERDGCFAVRIHALKGAFKTKGFATSDTDAAEKETPGSRSSREESLSLRSVSLLVSRGYIHFHSTFVLFRFRDGELTEDGAGIFPSGVYDAFIQSIQRRVSQQRRQP